jgi:hypothetical protein
MIEVEQVAWSCAGCVNWPNYEDSEARVTKAALTAT